VDTIVGIPQLRITIPLATPQVESMRVLLLFTGDRIPFHGRITTGVAMLRCRGIPVPSVAWAIEEPDISIPVAVPVASMWGLHILLLHMWLLPTPLPLAVPAADDRVLRHREVHS
jgi:hypothetical protein